MKIIVERTPDETAHWAAARAADYIRENPGRLLCFAAGDTPKGMLSELVRMQMQAEIDLNRMYFAAINEWAGFGADAPGSCARLMLDTFYGPAGVNPDHCALWDGSAPDMDVECARMDRWIRKRGGIGLAVVGIGADGHVGFNEPGTPADACCHVASLTEETREAGRKYFNGADAPAHGLTVGLGQLLAAEEIFLMALSADKAPVIRRALIGEPDERCPASLLQRHENYRIFTDRKLFAAL